jgi:hypothetical protein
MQDNDESPAVRNAQEGNFQFLNTDGGFDNSGAWTKEIGWLVTGSQAKNSLYQTTNRIYQNCSISNGDSIRICLQTVTPGSGFNKFAAYAGGTQSTLPTYPADLNLILAAGATDTYIGIKIVTTPGMTFYYFDRLFAWNLDDFPLAGVVQGISPNKTQSISTTPGKVQARCFDFNGTSYVLIDQDMPGAILSIAFWVNADDLTDRNILLLYTQWNHIAIDADSKIIVAQSKASPGWVLDTDYEVYIDNVKTNTLTSGWHFVVINFLNLDLYGFDNPKIAWAGGSGFDQFDGKLELLEFFSYTLDSNERAFLWNDGEGTTELQGELTTVNIAALAGRANNLLGA